VLSSRRTARRVDSLSVTVPHESGRASHSRPRPIDGCSVELRYHQKLVAAIRCLLDGVLDITNRSPRTRHGHHGASALAIDIQRARSIVATTCVICSIASLI
jgi:hypothetical protein